MKYIFGFHAILSRIRHCASSITEIYVDVQRVERLDKRMQQLINVAQHHNLRIIELPRERLDGLSGHGTHQGVVAKVTPLPLKNNLEDLLEDLQKPACFLILDSITDPHNLGACLRVADAAGVDAIIAPKDRAVGLNATVIKVASGAADTVPYITVTNLARTLRLLKERDVWVLGTSDLATQNIYQSDLRRSIAWVMGSEAEGMRRLTIQTCDELLAIPMQGSVSSLNISVAAGVCLYETYRQRNA